MRPTPSRVLLPLLLLLLLLAAAPARVCARAPAPAAQQRELSSRETVVPFANLITFAVQAPMLVFDLFWTRYVAVRGAAHAARNSLRALGAEADLAEVAADVEAEAKAVGDLQGALFGDVLAADRAFVQAEARAALAAAAPAELCALAEAVFAAGEDWGQAQREALQRALERHREAVLEAAPQDPQPFVEEEPLDVEQAMPIMVDAAEAVATRELDVVETDELTTNDLIGAKKDTDAAELYKKRDFVALGNRARECGCGNDRQQGPELTQCPGLRKTLDIMLTRELAAVYKYYGYKGDTFAAQNKLVLFRHPTRHAQASDEAKPLVQKESPDFGAIKKQAANFAPLVPTKQQKDAPPPNAEASILGFLFFQKSARLDWIKSLEKEKWEAYGGSASPQYMLLYNSLMLFEFVTNAFRNLHIVFQLAKLSGETARFSLARGVGILKERSDVDKALQLHFACNNLRAIHTEAARLERSVFPPLSDNVRPELKYYRALGLATTSDDSTTVFSKWLDELPPEKTGAISQRVYRHYRESLSNLIFRAAAPFRKRAATVPSTNPDDTGIGRCYSGLKAMSELSGALKPTRGPMSGKDGWLLTAEAAEALVKDGLTESKRNLAIKNVHQLELDKAAAAALQSEARPAAFYVKAEDAQELLVATTKSAGNCNGRSARDIYDIILLSDSADNGAEVTPHKLYERLTPATPRRPPGSSGRSSFQRFTGSAGVNAELNAKLGFDRVWGTGCADCHPPEDVVIDALTNTRVVQKHGRATLFASRKLYVARCRSLEDQIDLVMSVPAVITKDVSMAARKHARLLAYDYDEEAAASRTDIEVQLQPIQHVHFIVLEREKEPLSWASDIGKQLNSGMRLVSGLRPHVPAHGVGDLAAMGKQRRTDHELLKRLTGKDKASLGVQAHINRAAFVELLDRSDLNRGQRGGKGNAKNGAPIILVFVGRGQVAPINDLQLVPFADMGSEESLKKNVLVDTENVVRAKYQGFWARWFRDQHDTKNSKQVANDGGMWRVMTKAEVDVAKGAAREGFGATVAGIGAKGWLNDVQKVTDIALPYVQSPATCSVTDTVELKRATEKVLTANWWWGKSKKARHARGYVTHKLHTECVGGDAAHSLPELWERVVISPKTGAAVYGSGSLSLMDYDAEVLRPFLWTRRRIIAHETDFAAIGGEDEL